MDPNHRQPFLACLVLGISVSFLTARSSAAEWEFSVQLSEVATTEPFSGRVYVFFSKRQDVEPRTVSRFVNSEPIIAKDVVAWKPGETVTLSTRSTKGQLSFPRHLTKLDLAGYRAQAVVRLNALDPQMGAGSAAAEGNAYSNVVELPESAEHDETLVLEVDKVAPIVPVRTNAPVAIALNCWIGPPHPLELLAEPDGTAGHIACPC